MPSKNDLQQLIVTHHRRLQKLKEQQALAGRSTDPEILIEIEDIEATLAELQAELKELQDTNPTELAADPIPVSADNGQQPKEYINQIPLRQNQKHFLQYLAAQRQLYEEEKKWMDIWRVVSISVAILGTGALAIFVPFTPYVTLMTALLMVIEFLVLPLITKRRQNAAKIQELFDCELLELPWSDIVGTKPKPETILAAVQRFEKQNNSTAWKKLKNWYAPSVGNLPLPQARIACQKENIWWDSKQRREYARWVYLATCGFLLIIILIGVIANWNFQQFLQGPLLLALPVLAIGFKHGREHQQAAERLDKLSEFADRLWQEAVTETFDPNAITQRSRELQTKIFDHRSEDSPIPSWYYDLQKKDYENLIKKILRQE